MGRGISPYRFIASPVVGNGDRLRPWSSWWRPKEKETIHYDRTRFNGRRAGQTPPKKDGTEKETIDGPTFYQIAQTQIASLCSPAYQRSFQVPSRHYQFSSGGGGLYLGSDLMCCSEATGTPVHLR